MKFMALCPAVWLSCAITASAATHYVDLNSPNPLPPYTNWSSAATNIQDAIDAASAGDQILVTNGVYATGGRPINGFVLTNRVAVTKPVTLQSVNGPAVTVIQGYQVPGMTNGGGAVRCVYLTNAATLMGFTLPNGATRSSGDPNREESGGGVWCESVDAVLFNCVLSGNAAYSSGGGVYNGLAINCALDGNSACSNGGGGCYSVQLNCTLTHNSAASGAGGAEGGALYYCTLSSNSAAYGGGAGYAILNNCTLSGNSASTSGGGADGSTLSNCVVTGNSANFRG